MPHEETLSELIEKSTGAVDCADLDRWLKQARALVAEMPHTLIQVKHHPGYEHAIKCWRCKWQALLSVPPAERGKDSAK